MNAKLLALGALVLGCVVAAGAGAYVAVRHNAAAVTAPAQATTAPATTAGPNETTGVQTPVVGDGWAAAEAPAEVRPDSSAPNRSADRRPDQGTQPAPRATRTGSPQPDRPARPASVTTAPAAGAPPGPAMPAVVELAQLPPPLVPVEEHPAPLTPQFEEVVVPADAVVGLRVENSVSSETASVEDSVTARVTRDVRVAGQVAIPAGSRVQGSVVVVVRGGKFKERARLGVRFHTLITDEGAVPMQTEVVFREGESKTGEAAAKMSAGAIGGALIGALVGGGRGAAIGGAAGAGAGTAAVAASDRSEAILAAGSNVTVRLSQPVVIETRK